MSVSGLTAAQSRKKVVFSDAVTATVRQTVEALLSEWNLFADPAAPVQVDVLAGGANNINLKVIADSSTWALKLCDPIGVRFGVDRRSSIQAQQDAARVGLAPRIRASKLPEGHFMSEFVCGTTLRPEIIRDEGLAPRLAATLRKLHQVGTTCRDFSLFEDIRTFMRGADAAGGKRPNDFDGMYRLVCRLEELLLQADAPRGFGHNDPVPQNFIAASGCIYLVDFDYSGITWTAVDLACATSQALMTDDEVEGFLRAYDPDLDDGQRARVEVLRFVNTLREVAWAAMAEPILQTQTTLMDGWSYQWHADNNLKLAQEMLKKRSFESLATEAVKVRPGALF